MARRLVFPVRSRYRYVLVPYMYRYLDYCLDQGGVSRTTGPKQKPKAVISPPPPNQISPHRRTGCNGARGVEVLIPAQGSGVLHNGAPAPPHPKPPKRPETIPRSLCRPACFQAAIRNHTIIWNALQEAAGEDEEEEDGSEVRTISYIGGTVIRSSRHESHEQQPRQPNT